MQKDIVTEKNGMFFINHKKIKVGNGKFTGRTNEGETVSFELPEIIILDVDNEYIFVCPK